MGPQFYSLGMLLRAHAVTLRPCDAFLVGVLAGQISVEDNQ